MKKTFASLRTWRRLHIEGPVASERRLTSCAALFPMLNRHLTKTGRGMLAGRANAYLPLVAMMGLALSTITVPAPPYEAAFLFCGKYPENEGTPFADEFQGLTHDDTNWFLSSNSHVPVLPNPLPAWEKVPQLWKVPVRHDLRHVRDDDPITFPGVIHVRINETPLAALGYDHFGDISYYQYGGQGYVIVPAENQRVGSHHALALFTADDLQYRCRAEVPWNNTIYPDFGWVAIDPQGRIFVSHDFDDRLRQYMADWSQLPNALPINEGHAIQLIREDGSPFNTGHAQGGVFSPSGALFYFLSGISEENDPDEGINVFAVDDSSTWTWRRISHSYQSINDYHPFWYPIETQSPNYDEPEGLTYWDLDDDQAPNIRGQLHVGVLDNEWVNFPFQPKVGDDVNVYHYRNTIDVNWQFVAPDPNDSTAWTGEAHKPFTTVTAANSVAWDGSRIRIQSGTYAEDLTVTKRIELSAKGGMVQIGPVP